MDGQNQADTVEISLGGRNYRAGSLTAEEYRQLEKIVQAMQVPANHRPGPPEAMRRLMRGVSEILAAAIARSGGAVTVDELLELAHAGGSGPLATLEAAVAFVRGAQEMAHAVKILRAATRLEKNPPPVTKPN